MLNGYNIGLRIIIVAHFAVVTDFRGSIDVNGNDRYGGHMSVD
jgi:hypothetical protein